MPFSETWFLPEHEGFLAQARLCNGLTALARTGCAGSGITLT